MTVTIHVDHASRTAVAQRLAALAGTAKAVKAGTAGFTVEDDIAVAFLVSQADPCCATAPPARPMHAALTSAVQGAEVESGVLDPERKPKPPAPPRNTRGRRPTTVEE